MDVKGLDKIITKLFKKYENEKICYEKLLQSWKKLENEEFIDKISIELEKIQEICNEYYEKYGFNDEILELQVWINQIRNQYDITDPREIIHIDNGKGFVQ